MNQPPDDTATPHAGVYLKRAVDFSLAKKEITRTYVSVCFNLCDQIEIILSYDLVSSIS